MKKLKTTNILTQKSYYGVFLRESIVNFTRYLIDLAIHFSLKSFPTTPKR